MENKDEVLIEIIKIFLETEEFKVHNLPEENMGFEFDFEKIVDFKDSNFFQISIITHFYIYTKDNGKEKILLTQNFAYTCFGLKKTQNNTTDDIVKNAFCSQLFPYIREHIATTTLNAGFPCVQLPPINVIDYFKNKEAKNIKVNENS